MKICVLGTGYVGLVAGGCFAELSGNVVCSDIDKEKIDNINRGQIPIYEPGLDEIIRENQELHRLHFTTNIKEAIADADIVFIAVGTPQKADSDEADLSYVLNAAAFIADYAVGYTLVVNKSTVPVGTAKLVAQEIYNRNNNLSFDVVSNPEFLREGHAVHDFMEPDRIVIGTNSEKAQQMMRDLYAPLTQRGYPMVVTSEETAELIKYASNALLAVKVGFINEMADLCQAINGDMQLLSTAIGLDKRIGPAFLAAGPGYGGSCFPKDTRALRHIAQSLGKNCSIVDATILANENRMASLLGRIDKHISLKKGVKISLFGLAFKADTDDVRESPAIKLANDLLLKGVDLILHDPQAAAQAKKCLKGGRWATSVEQALKDSDCAIFMTEWDVYAKIKADKFLEYMHRPMVIDFRNIFDKSHMINHDILYLAVGYDI